MNMNLKELKAELRLFKAYTLSYAQCGGNNTISSVERGLLYTSDVPDEVKEIAEEMYGIKPEQWNNTFHKSFQTVLDTPIEKLIAQQIVHYFTTYGLEAIGLFDSDLVYIPHEQLEIPEIQEDIQLQVIHRISEKDLSDKLLTLLSSGIALSKQTIEDIMTLSNYIDTDRFDEIKNREIKMALYDKYDIVPKYNMDFLKYVVFKTTNSTLYIQSNEMIHTIKNANKEKAYVYFNGYVTRKDGYKKLAEIFLRNKNIFLAFKTPNTKNAQNKALNSIINKISKYAVKYHKPLEKNILDNLSSIKTLKGIEENKVSILNELDKITVFREMRILNGLKYRLQVSDNGNSNNSIVYRIRNGKVYATSLDDGIKSDRQARVLAVIIGLIENHLTKRLEPIFKDKTFYIPDGVLYTVPTSEKQFIGSIPEGSYIEIPRKSNMVVGVHWFNLDNERVDLDLKMLNKGEQYGWNSAYYSDESDIVFSGDVTDAPRPNGATEVFLISPKVHNKSFLLKLNDFTQCESSVPFEFFVAELDNSEISKNYVVNPNKVLVSVNNKFDKDFDNKVSTLTLGYIETTDDVIRIYFKNFEDIKGRVSKPDEVNSHIQDYTDLYSKVQLKLNDLIISCGGKLVSTNKTETLEEVEVNGEILYKKVVHPVDYDLSLETLTRDNMIKLFGGN